MFGFTGGEPREALDRKKAYRVDAKKRWAFLTNIDFHAIKNPAQLQKMVQIRSGISESQAKSDTEKWLRGKDFSSEVRRDGTS
jgi:hypothetical protein